MKHVQQILLLLIAAFYFGKNLTNNSFYHTNFSPYESSHKNGTIPGIISVPLILKEAIGWLKGSSKKPSESWKFKQYKKYFKQKLGNYKKSKEKQLQILQQHDLYQYSDFCQFAKTLPELDNYLDQFRDRIAWHHCLTQPTENVHRYDSRYYYLYQFLDRFDAPKKQQSVPQIATNQPAFILPESNKNHDLELIIKKSLQEDAIQLKQYCEIYEFQSNNTRFSERLTAIELINQKQEKYQIKNYEFSINAVQLLKDNAIDYGEYKQFYGNELQQVLHKQTITVIEKTANLKLKQKFEIEPTIYECIVNSAHVSFSANKVGFVIKSIDFLEVAWTLCDYASAICEGITEGVIQAAYDIADTVTHPIDAAAGLLKNLYNACCAIGKVIAIQGEFAARELFPWLENKERSFELVDKVARVCSVVDYLAELPPRELIKNTTAALVQPMVFNKFFKSLNLLFKAGKSRIVDYANVLKKAKEQPTIIYTPYLLPSAVAAQTAETIFDAAGQVAQSSNGIIQGVHSIEEAIQYNQRAIEQIKQILGPIEEEIAQLAKEFNNTRKGFAEFANKRISFPLKHILGIEFELSKKGRFSFSGFHHDFNGILENSGLMHVINKQIFKDGFYKADVIINGLKLEKTFFPQQWGRRKVVETIYELYDNFLEKGALNYELGSSGKYKINSIINEEVKLRAFLTKYGHVASTFPVME